MKKTREEKKREREEMLRVFLNVWEKRKHYSEVSGKWLGEEPLSIFFHHILPKSKYREAMLDEENIILLTPDEHARVESNPKCFDEVNKRREKLLMKYDRSSQKGLLEQE